MLARLAAALCRGAGDLFAFVKEVYFMTHSDRELILACREGKADAWTEVIDQYERLVYSIPLRYGLSRDDAADIAQLTFTILLQSVDNLEENSQLGGWLATVAKRHTWRLLRRRQREVSGYEAEFIETALQQQNGHEPGGLRRWERLEWLTAGLNDLGDRCRQLLLALYFDEAEPSYAEIADRLEMRTGSIGPTRARCLEKLRTILGELPV